jgi:DNA-binding XRE family transcriptional regulator
MKKISDWIRVLREMKGLSQENMALELGISQQGYS